MDILLFQCNWFDLALIWELVWLNHVGNWLNKKVIIMAHNQMEKPVPTACLYLLYSINVMVFLRVGARL